MKRIMIDVDFSDHAEKVLDAGLDIASKYGAEVILMHAEKPAALLMESNVAGPYGGMSGLGMDMSTANDVLSEQIQHDEEVLLKLKERVAQRGLKATTEICIGNEAPLIVEKCHALEPDLLVIGVHKMGFFSQLLGDHPEFQLVKKAPCALLIVPERTY